MNPKKSHQPQVFSSRNLEKQMRNVFFIILISNLPSTWDLKKAYSARKFSNLDMRRSCETEKASKLETATNFTRPSPGYAKNYSRLLFFFLVRIGKIKRLEERENNPFPLNVYCTENGRGRFFSTLSLRAVFRPNCGERAGTARAHVVIAKRRDGDKELENEKRKTYF